MATESRQIRMLNPTSLQVNPWNCNTMTEDEVDSLMKSMVKEGVQNVAPPIVRPLGPSEKYQIVDGEHRVFVAKKLGWSAIPCIIAEVDDQQARRMCLALNLIHGRINPIKLFELLFSEWEGGTGKLSTRELETAYGHIIGQSWISRILQLRNLSARVKEEASKFFDGPEGGVLTSKHLLVIAKLESPEEQMKFLRAVIATGVSVPTLERMVGDQVAKKVEGSDSEGGNGDGNGVSVHEEDTLVIPQEHLSGYHTDSMMKCECGTAYIINWRRKTASKIVEEGDIAKAIQVPLVSKDIRVTVKN